MFSEEQLRKLASFLVSFKNFKAWRKLEKTGSRSSSAYLFSNKNLSEFGYNATEIENIHRNYRDIAISEIRKGTEAGIQLIPIEDDAYPPLLREIFQPPEFLYVKGDPSVLDGGYQKLAVVGARKRDEYGKEVLETIIPDISAANIVVVSGMAFGIDALSHRIALRHGGKTIGVNAGGLLKLYPAGNGSLFPGIIENGCIISEFPLDVVPRPFFFPIRNRIISGISEAVFVVQATLKSGSLITARLAVEQNRDVFTVPGNLFSPLSAGPHYLLKQGAKVIERSADILEEFGIEVESSPSAVFDLTEAERNLLDLIDSNGVKRVDYFVENSDFTVSEVISHLMGLVLKGVLVETEAGYRKLRND